MEAAKLVMMANQIGKFFAAQRGADPVAAIANHLDKFWEPRMRAELLKSLGTAEEARLKPVVRAAVKALGQADAV